MIKTCDKCGTTWLFEDDDVILMFPFPHYECPKCGFFIPAFWNQKDGSH